MISMLRGKIDIKRDSLLIVDVSGVGYRINILGNINISDHDLNQEIKLYIHEHIKEDQYELYGFLSYQELELFKLLISVSGIGPKAAQNIMMSGDDQQIFSAIENSDVAYFTSISGIGKKVAAKIILELKSKINESDSRLILLEENDDDSVSEGLMALGYKKHEIHKLISKIPREIDGSEDKIRWLLKNLK